MMDRGVKITLGGEEYFLLLTTGATKALSKRYNGLENLGEKLMAGETADAALDEVAWLLVTLINQGVAYENRICGASKKPLTVEDIDLLTSPAELIELKSAISDAMLMGMKRNIISEDDEKNVAGE